MAATEQFFSQRLNSSIDDVSPCMSSVVPRKCEKSAATSRSDSNCNYTVEDTQSEDGISHPHSEFGKDYSKIKEKLEEYRCLICMEILVNTSMISCGHRFCLYCIKQWFHYSHPKQFCPVCRKNCVYYQDDADTDINISNLYRCLPIPDQEERNVTLLTREYTSGIPNSRLPHPQNPFIRLIDELPRPWTSQFTNTIDVAAPFELESMNSIMAENYYPSFMPYLSYETPFPELEYHERTVSAPHQPALTSQTNPEGTISYQPSSSVGYANSTAITSSSLEAISTNGPVELTYSRAGYMQTPAPPLRVSTFGGFTSNDVYSSENLEIENLIGNPCPAVYAPLPVPGENLGNYHYGNSLPPTAPPILDYPAADPLSLMPGWSPTFPDQNPGIFCPSLSNLPGAFDNHAAADHYKQACAAFESGRSINPLSDEREPYRLPEAPLSVTWNTESISEHVQLSLEWHVATSHAVDSNWDIPALTSIEETNQSSSLATGIHRSRFSKGFASNPPNTSHEDYQQDVLIQEEFQRLDEMLLRDDDDIFISESDQVSVESVASSEHQYDMPWDVPSNQTRSKDIKTTTAPVSTSDQPPITAPSTTTTTASACQGNRLSTVTSSMTSRPPTVDETPFNSEPRMEMHNLGNKIQDKKLFSQGFTNPTKKFPLTPVSIESKGFRSKILTKPTLEIPRQFQPLELQQRCPEAKRIVERHRMEEIPVAERPTVNKPMDVGPSPLDIRQGALTARRTTPRLPKMRSDQRTKKVLSLKKKPPTRASTPGLPEIITPNNMMGVSRGDGIWCTVPEMSAHMYLPYGMLLFKMEYQPHVNTLNSFTSAAKHQQQHHQQPQQQQNTSNLVKFTHPVIHMLPLSSDGSTRLNITFDVVYQT